MSDDVDQFVGSVAVPSSELHEISGPGEHRSALGRRGDMDAAATAELKQPLVAQLSQRSQDSVGVDIEYGGEVSGGWEALSGGCLALRDRAADLCGYLVVEQHRLIAVDLDTQHRASNTSVILEGIGRYLAPARWAVIKDARRRQRRRQRQILTIATVLLAAATIGWAIARSSGLDHAPISPPAAVEAVTQVHPGGIIESTTSLRGNLWVLTCLQHCSEPWSSALRGQLVELAAAGHPIKRLPVADPGAVAGGEGSIWVAHFYSGQVTRIDPQTGRRTATLQLKLPRPITTSGDRRFIPSAISFSSDRVSVSTARGWTAEIDPHTAQVIRMAYSSSEAPSATTAAGLTWVADELAGIGTFSATSAQVTRHQITWAGQPLDVNTVAYGAGLIWALGSETNYTVSLINPPTTSVVTTINPHTSRILHQWRVGNTATMVLAGGGAYVGDDRDGRILHLIPPNHTQVMYGPKTASLTAATAHTLWATTDLAEGVLADGVGPTRLLRIELTQR